MMSSKTGKDRKRDSKYLYETLEVAFIEKASKMIWLLAIWVKLRVLQGQVRKRFKRTDWGVVREGMRGQGWHKKYGLKLNFEPWKSNIWWPQTPWSQDLVWRSSLDVNLICQTLATSWFSFPFHPKMFLFIQGRAEYALNSLLVWGITLWKRDLGHLHTPWKWTLVMGRDFTLAYHERRI